MTVSSCKRVQAAVYGGEALVSSRAAPFAARRNEAWRHWRRRAAAARPWSPNRLHSRSPLLPLLLLLQVP